MALRFTTATRLVLDVIMSASDEEPAWGYRIIEEAGLGSGTVYPILERLEDAELIEGAWELSPPPERPARRVYTITGAGRVWYDQHARRPARAVLAPGAVAR